MRVGGGDFCLGLPPAKRGAGYAGLQPPAEGGRPASRPLLSLSLANSFHIPKGYKVYRK